MYLGYIIMIMAVLNFVLSIGTFVMGIKNNKYMKAEDIPTELIPVAIMQDPKVLTTNLIFNTIKEIAIFFQGYFMVMATKSVVREISLQKMNPMAKGERNSHTVYSN